MKKVLVFMILLQILCAKSFKDITLEAKDSFDKNLVYSIEVSDAKDFQIDLDNDGKKELFELSKEKGEYENILTGLKINSKVIENIDFQNVYYIDFLKYNNEILLGLGYSDNGVDPSTILYRYSKNKIIQMFDDHFSSLYGYKNNKLYSWWDTILACDDFYNMKASELNFIRYYDCIKKEWIINSKIIGKKYKNNYQNNLIFKQLESAYNYYYSREEATIKNLSDIWKKSPDDINGILKYGENFKILKIEDDILLIESESGKKGYIGRGHMVWN